MTIRIPRPPRRPASRTAPHPSQAPVPVPGFSCPVCGARISFSLDAFLYQAGHTCVGCGTRFEMDRQESRQALEDVEQIKVAKENLERVRGRSQ